MKILRLIMVVFSVLSLTLFFTACTWFKTTNNDRTLLELVRYMEQQTGGKFLCEMEPGPFHAESGASIMLEGRQVAFYKYNTDRKKQVKKLEYVDANGILYFAGLPLSAVRNGSFVMLDYETNAKKKELLKAFKSF